jgi:hypothetical protein
MLEYYKPASISKLLTTLKYVVSKIDWHIQFNYYHLAGFISQGVIKYIDEKRSRPDMSVRTFVENSIEMFIHKLKCFKAGKPFDAIDTTLIHSLEYVKYISPYKSPWFPMCKGHHEDDEIDNTPLYNDLFNTADPSKFFSNHNSDAIIQGIITILNNDAVLIKKLKTSLDKLPQGVLS